MSTCIEKVKCPGNILLSTGQTCTGKKKVQVFGQEDGRVDGYCFACDQYVEHPYDKPASVETLPARKVKTPEEIELEIREVFSYPTVDVTQRKLRKTTLEAFGARVSMSEQDGETPTAIYWPVTKNGEQCGWHVKPLWEKGFPYFLGDGLDTDLIGWEEAKKVGSKRLIITEGPEDMASVHRIYEMYGNPDWFPAIASLPRGARSVKQVFTRQAKELRRFKEVVLCFDDDEAGRDAVKQAMLILPKAMSVTLPCKDANECIVKGVAKAAYKELSFNAEKPKNSSLIFGSAIHAAAREEAQWGKFTWPFPKVNEATRGIRLGDTIYIGAGCKMGKGELRNEIAAHIMKQHNAKIFMSSFEETNKKTYKLLAGKLESKFFHDPKKPFDFEAYDRAGLILQDKLALVDIYQTVAWETLASDIVAAASWGAEAFFIDPITNFTAGIDSGQANTILQGLARSASALALDLGVVMFLFCHLKAPESGTPHERGGTIHSNQFAGSRGMMQACNLMIGLQGNKDPDLSPDERNMRELVILEDREFGVTGKFPLFWNEHTSRFTEC